MSIERVKKYLSRWGRDQDVIELDGSSATVELAAAALSVPPARIAKSLTFAGETGCILIVAAGDGKVDNKKFKQEFSIKAKMIKPDEVVEATGYEIGGVCPFDLDADKVRVYLDESLKRFDVVYPAAGSHNSCIGLTLEELSVYSGSIKWVDVCRNDG